MKNYLLAIALFTISNIIGQSTGLLSLKEDDIYQGYTLVYPHFQSNVYLMDNCGSIVHQWDDDVSFRPGNTAYLMPDGNLVRAKRPGAVGQDPIWAGGGGATIEILDWEGTSLWSFTQNDSLRRLHHDIAVLPNGNILAISWEKWTREQSIEAGRDTAKLSQDQLWPDYILEIDPDTDQIVWEWHVTDHLIQDFDSTKANYGVIADHPELVDLNYDSSNGAADWMHSNALDYNPDLDQILLSVPTFDEVWIIDHSTTTAQASGHSGGKSNRGGDLMYRIGNPITYGAGTTDDRILYYQHDAHWILDVPINHPDYGKVMLFNNRVTEDMSTIEIFNPRWDMYTWSYETNNGLWQPSTLVNTVAHPGPRPFSSSGLSSAQLLPNNNILTVSGRQGYWTELDENRNIVWEYITPLKRGVPASRFDTLELNDNLTFRIYKYPIDYAAFDGRDLSTIGYIESDPDTAWCMRLVPVVDLVDVKTSLYPNPVSETLMIEWESGGMVTAEVYDVSGKVMMTFEGNGGKHYQDVSILNSGLYFMSIRSKDTVFQTQKFIKVE